MIAERWADGPGLALLDVDGTLTTVRSIWQHVLHANDAWDGKGDVNLEKWLAGEIDYVEFCHRDAELLRGVPYANLRALCDEVPRRPGLRVFVEHLQRSGYKVAIVSTGLRMLSDPIAEEFGLDHCIANDFEVVDLVCTGRAVVSIHEEDKGRHAADLIAAVRPRHVIAVGDGMSDLAMFALADLAVAVGDVSDRVSAAADVHLVDGDLAQLVSLLPLPAGVGR